LQNTEGAICRDIEQVAVELKRTMDCEIPIKGSGTPARSLSADGPIEA
jgi:hypothetical protein